MRKLIAFDDDTFDKLKQLARDRMATIQELADEAFADLLRKHGIPVDLRDALRKSAPLSEPPAKNDAGPASPRKAKSWRTIKDLHPKSEIASQPIFFKPLLNRGPLPT